MTMSSYSEVCECCTKCTEVAWTDVTIYRVHVTKYRTCSYSVTQVATACDRHCLYVHNTFIALLWV